MSRALLALALLVACRNGGEEQLARVKAAVCACKTASCAETAMKGVPQAPVASSHRSQQLARDMMDCLSKLYDDQRPSTDPDAATATAPEISAPASAKTP